MTLKRKRYLERNLCLLSPVVPFFCSSAVSQGNLPPSRVSPSPCYDQRALVIGDSFLDCILRQL